MVGAMGNGAVGSWESSVIVEGKEGETAGVIGDWEGRGGEVEEDAESNVCAGRNGTEGRSATVGVVRLPFLAATTAFAGGLGTTVAARAGKSAAVRGVEVWWSSSRVMGRSGMIMLLVLA